MGTGVPQDMEQENASIPSLWIAIAVQDGAFLAMFRGLETALRAASRC